MSSEDESRSHKKRRSKNSCDVCKRKKAKCDSETMPDNICTNCLASNIECTHNLLSKRRGPKSGVYVEQLEKRIQRLEEALLNFVPYINLDTLLVDEPDRAGNQFLDTAATTNLQPDFAHGILPTFDDQFHAMEATFGKMHVEKGFKGRFFGPSSSHTYFMDAIKAKRSNLSAEPADLKNEHPELERDILGLKRPQYWGLPYYEIATRKKQTVQGLNFPPDELLTELIDIHFRTTHWTMPILHEPSFRKKIQERRHHHEPDFGRLVMMMCALSSRDSEDSRVILPGQYGYSAGWKYYEQVQVVRQWMFEAPSLHELQMYCLAVKYLLGTSAPQNAWPLVSLGLRLSYELGIHRKRPPDSPVTIYEEERKRVFWHLVGVDRFLSSMVGRPPGCRDEDFDADLPAECDDEYIFENDDGTILFLQPTDKPSKMLYMSCMSRLLDILSVALRALYSTMASRVQMGLTGTHWKQDAVTELDSALNRWLDTIPDHLRWNTEQTDHTFFVQSGALHITYNIVQIQIHRAFINPNEGHSSLSSTICTRSARSIAGVLRAHMDRGNIQTDHVHLLGCFMATVTLLMEIWRNERQGIVSYQRRTLIDVERCRSYLKFAERRWCAAGRFHDLTSELSLAKDFPAHHGSPPRYANYALDNEISSCEPANWTNDTGNPSGNMWLANYIPQYSGRQDFPLIPMQVPLFTGLFEALPGENTELEVPHTESLWTTGDQLPLAWHAPMGLDMTELDQRIFGISGEVEGNVMGRDSL